MKGITNTPYGVSMPEYLTLVALVNKMKTTYEITFYASDWIESGGLWRQTVSGLSYSSSDVPQVAFTDPESLSPEQVKEYDKNCALVRYFETGEGTLTATCKLGKPTMDLVILAKGI